MTAGVIERPRIADAAWRTATDEKLIARLRDIASVRLDEPLGRHTTFGIGGPADVFVTVRSADELGAAFGAAMTAGTPCFILGSGSNILVGDAGVRGVVIDNQAKGVHIGDADGGVHVTAESGASFAALARNLSRQGIGGIEWACGIPGSLGGAAVYNAGAYGGELSDVAISARVAFADGTTRKLTAPEMGLRYRSSVFLRHEIDPCAVLDVTFAAFRGDAAAMTARIAEIDAARLTAQPRGRTGGSTFKNPEGHKAWELIDAAGLRGYRIGDAQISDKHCNFFLNTGAARAADVFALMQEARRRVQERFGITLENEVELVGEGF